jgi:amino acid adenylation domain-containing protein
MEEKAEPCIDHPLADNLTDLGRFWKNFLKGFTAPTPLVVDKTVLKREPIEVEYCEQTTVLASGFEHQLKKYGIEISTLIQGGWALLLSHYSGEADVLFGIQGSAPEQPLIPLAHPLPMRVSIMPEAPLLPWLKQLQAEWTTLPTDRHTSLVKLQAWSDVPADAPLFESLLILPDAFSGSDSEGQEHQQACGSDGLYYPLTIWGSVTPNLSLRIRYDRHRFEDTTITRMLGHLQTLLEGMIAHPDAPIAALPILPESEQQLLAQWNQTEMEFPQDQCIHQRVETQVTKSPDEIAVVFEDQQLTYQELNQKANQLAHYLQSLGVGPDVLVGICCDRSLEMVIGVLGILKAGGAYVPLDPAYPRERIAFMVEDTQATVLLTQHHLKAHLPPSQARVLCLDTDWQAIQAANAGDQPPNSGVTPNHLAYIIYTSGSTGKPKGVQIQHRSAVNLLNSVQRQPGLTAQDTLLSVTTLSFDIAVSEVFLPLMVGAKLVVVSREVAADGIQLLQVMNQVGATFMQPTPATWRMLLAIGWQGNPHLKMVSTGEPLPRDLADQLIPKGKELWNLYGPTETTIWSAGYRVEADHKPITIGYPIANTQLYILDQRLQPVPIGVPGELHIGGAGLARGYLNRPDLTAEKFIPNPFSEEPNSRLYKTGDLARWLPSGEVECLGRIDHQVKVRGYRIELGEIEAALLQHDAVKEAVVVARSDTPAEKVLVAYFVPAIGTGEAHQQLIPELRQLVKSQMPSFMVPSAFVALEAMPLTPNGKVDRKALPKPGSARPELMEQYVAPRTAFEQKMGDIWAQTLNLEKVGIHDNFFDLGGTSILGLQLVARIQEQLGSTLRPVKLYQYPTVRALVEYLDREADCQQTAQGLQLRSRRQQPGLTKEPENQTSTALDGVALIGMVGRFPGAKSVEELWNNLCGEVESITFFAEDEIDPSVDPELRHDSHYVRARGVIQDAETFDAAFFGISPREAEVMDPQMRVFLELAQEALENSGYTPENYQGLIGLYAGSGQNTYFERHICGRPEIINRLGAFQTMLANEKDFLTTRASYKLNLTGPSVSINTACSTSLVAVIQAVQNLLNDQCDIALAGGISITTPQNTGYLYQEGGMLSPDGHCRPFDARAQGTTFNSGAGIVVLKRLADALADGDRIYAVIKGTGINNDGADKVSFTAPSVEGQVGAIAMAQNNAGFHPETITYVETHGTATPLGDPIEIEALTQAFRLQTNANRFCAIGSIKSNVGHLVAAAGVAGLIKTALALYYKKIPPSLNFEAPNPEIDFEHSPFYVNTQLTAWQASDTPRRAGVSSFGVGGTNAHVVLEEAPIVAPSGPSRPRQLLFLSAKTSTALEQATANLKAHLQQHSEVNLADVAYTLQEGRKAFNHRRFVVCQTVEEAISLLETPNPNRAGSRQTETRDPEIVFMFPGQGSQYANMGLSLYAREPVFQAAVDRCVEILKPLLGKDLREILYPADQDDEIAAAALRQTVYTQPALFTIEYALAQLWQSWGVKPAAMIGHSIGEFVAACLAGVFSLEDGLKLVAARGRLMWELPGGSMLSVRLSAEGMQQRLSGDLAIAAINGPALCVVSGPTEAIANLQQELEAEEIVCRPLHTSHAFHSPMMDPIIEPFAKLVRTIPLALPQIPFVSTVTTDWITDAQATDPLYWASHLRATVRFAEGVKTLWQQPSRVLLEVGPRTTAATLARQQAKDPKQQIAVSSLGSTTADDGEWATLLQAIGQLWLVGVSLDWPTFYTNEYRHRLPLPTYPFERQRYWIDPKPATRSVVEAPHPAVGQPVQAPIASSISTTQSIQPVETVMTKAHTSALVAARKQQLIPMLKVVFETTSGFDFSSADEVTTFLELGLDSLSLTQVALALKKKFKVKITFRHLLENYPNLDTLADFIEQSLPPSALPTPTVPVAAQTAAPVDVSVPVAAPISAPTTYPAMTTAPNSGYSYNSNGNGNGANGAATPAAPVFEGGSVIEGLIAQQLQIVAQQLELLKQERSAVAQPATASVPPIAAQVPPVVAPSPPVAPAVVQNPAAAAKTQETKPQRNFGPGAKIEKSSNTNLTREQQTTLDRIIARYTARTPESKRQAQEHRRYLADPRTVSGFTPLLKEIVYPIVTERSSGSRLWDVDGNEYVDLTNGFGVNFFGWSPSFITDALKAQLDKGIEIGPQNPLAGRVAKMFTELTATERVAFCNTGSEAVMAAMRLSRTVSGRSEIAIFASAYHGTIDEVIVRGGANLKSFPAAPGIMPSMFENILVLDYDAPESLEILRNRADDLAAIMVEPVQSRRPELQPKAFLHELRNLTQQSGTALIFDEVVTGFRIHPGGAQAHFGIQADLATYGKVIGGGLPIGVIAGKAEYMDALDGGVWQFGDDSAPEVGVTFFAGTFVRHPLALAAAEAVLLRLKAEGPELQHSLNVKTEKFASHLNQHFESVQAPIRINHFGALFSIAYPHELTWGGLLFYLLREKGVHVWEHRPCFLTLAHSNEDIEFVIQAFKNSVAEMQAAGFLPKPTSASSLLKEPTGGIERNRPPQADARLGRDPQGNPAWFIPDPERAGKYLQVQTVS